MPTGIYIRTPEIKEKLKLGQLGRKCLTKTREKISKANKGKHFSSTTEFKKGHTTSTEVREKMSKSLKGKISPKYWLGKKRPSFSKETRERMSKARQGIKLSNETKQKLSKIFSGEKGPLWKGGISFEPYSVDWTETLRRSVRERDKYICQICKKEPAIYVHHIDYNKKNCNVDNLITLCHFCHSKTNHNRKYWQNYFTGGYKEVNGRIP